MRLTWLKEKRITRSDFGNPILVAHVATAGNDEVKLRFSRMRVIRTKRFAFRNSDKREVKRMPLRQVERLRLASERDRNILRDSPKLSLSAIFVPVPECLLD